MIARLARALEQAGINPDSIQLAEILWIAGRRTTPYDRTPPSDASIGTRAAVESAEIEEPFAEEPELRDLPLLPGSGEPAALYPQPKGVTPVPGAMRVQLPAPVALPDRLNLGRALRPLKLRRPVSRHEQLDLDATVQLFGETGLLTPVMCPGSERWFDVALVVDTSPTMDVWEPTIAELGKLLTHHGAFRQVRRWKLMEHDEQVRIISEAGLRCDPSQIVDVEGRRLTMVITDCVGALWYGTQVWSAIQQWGSYVPVVLVQMLPPRLWASTALGSADVTLTGYRPGQPNRGLRAELPWWVLDERPAGVVPVVTLSQEDLSRWARMVIGVGGAHVLGTIAEAPYQGDVPTRPTEGDLEPAERVAAFKSTVSPQAYELAVCLSAVPIRLPIARIVQHAMLPEYDLVHLAEVFASGLIKRITALDAPVPADDVEYDFVNGVREVLQSSLTATGTLQIFRAVSRFLDTAVGRSPSFTALIAGQPADAEIEPELRPFAQVGAQLLERLGLRAMGKGETAAHGELVKQPEESLGEIPVETGASPITEVKRYARSTTHAGYADLEIGLHRRDRKTWTVELRFSHPESDADEHLELASPLRVGFDLDALQRERYDAEVYGRRLTDSLFGAPGVRHGFEMARTLAQSADLPLRIRLLIGASAPELHDVWWETLRDPQDGTPLLMDEGLLFSRYLASRDWRPVVVRPQSAMRALVAVANPSDIGDYEADGRSLPPVDVDGELGRARSALAPIPVTALASGGAATVAGIVNRLREGHEILYLACHGYLVDGELQVLLEDAAGRVHRVPGVDLVDALRDLQRLPRLVVLASCQSAGGSEEAWSDDQGALAALGPRMAEAGVPAVLAMQGNVSMQTVATFMPAFFTELNRSGQIDRAMAVARRAVQDRPDWWVPVLFMRLRSGRFWYAPGFARNRFGFEQWPALYSEIRKGRCTPILGPGLTDGYWGSYREIAYGWARQYHFPMAPHHRQDLASVAQFLAVNQGTLFLRDELLEYLRDQLLKRYEGHLSTAAASGSVDELITEVGAYRRSIDQSEPFAVLARLPFKIFINASHTNLLADALRAEGKDPQVEFYRWRDSDDDDLWPRSVFDDPASRYAPSPERPLVYHLFGHVQNPDTLVMTEDEYLAYLTGIKGDIHRIHEGVRRALTDSALLLLGFHIDEWSYRVLPHIIISQGPQTRRLQYSHIAQIDPEEEHTVDPDRARRYLESYFSMSEISIYWGGVEDFLRRLDQGWQRERR